MWLGMHLECIILLAGQVFKAPQILNPAQHSSQISQHHHPLPDSLALLLCFRNTSFLPYHGLEILCSLCLETFMTSHLGNPDSAFMSELRSYFLGHAFPGNHLRQVSPGFLSPNTHFIHSQSWQCLVSAYTLTCVPLLSVSVRKRLISQFQESKSGSFSFRWGALYPETKIHITRIKPLSGKKMEFHGRKGSKSRHRGVSVLISHRAWQVPSDGWSPFKSCKA